MAHARRYELRRRCQLAAVACAQAFGADHSGYGIERVCQRIGNSMRQHDRGLRQEQAPPLLERLQAYLLEQRAAALPKSPLGTATGYALRNWAALDPLRPKTGASKSTIMARSRRYDRSCWAGRTGCSRAVKRQRTGPPSCVHSSRPASTCRSIPSSTCAMSSSAFRLHPARLVLELTPRKWKRLRQRSGAQAAA